MARYINADLTDEEILDKVQAETSDGDTFITVRRILNSFPAEDVAPVKHGHWKDCGSLWDGVDEYEVWRCSNCVIPNYKRTRYCPNCGAKMERGEDDECNEQSGHNS